MMKKMIMDGINSVILICGDKNWSNYKSIEEFLTPLDRNTIIVTGGSRGADLIATELAKKLLFKQVLTFYAEWSIYGRAAGPIRNRKMFNETQPNLVVAFHNNLDNSKGTKDMVNYAKSKQCNVLVIKTN